MQNPHQAITERINACPPFVVYYLAHEGVQHRVHPGVKAIAERSGLSTRTITRLAGRVSWAGVPVDVMDRFCAACGMSFIAVTRYRVKVPKKPDAAYWSERVCLINPSRDYFRTLLKRKWKVPFRHLSQQQKDRFNHLSGKWMLEMSRKPVTASA